MTDSGASVPPPPPPPPGSDCPPGHRGYYYHSPYDHGIDNWMAMSHRAVHAWTRMLRELSWYEPYATLSECYVGAWSSYFTGAKWLQTVPGMGGQGRKGRVVRAGAAPVTVTAVVDRVVTTPVYLTAFVNGYGYVFPQNAISPPVVTTATGETTISITFNPPAGIPAGTYGGSILNSRYRLLVGPVQVDIPAG